MVSVFIADPAKRITAEKALLHPYVKPELCRTITINIDQDCHEMWVKSERRKAQQAMPKKA